MKKISKVLALVMLFLGALTYYFMYHADAGADGLGTFIPLVFVGVLFLCSTLAFLLSLFLNKTQSTKTRNWITVVAIALPILGFLGVSGTFASFTLDYQNDWEDKIEKEKTVLENLTFINKDFRISFNYVSGRVSEYHDGEPIPTPITPHIKSNSLLVPVDDNSYLKPDILLKKDFNPNSTVEAYFKNVKKQMGIVDATLKEQSLNDFKNLDANTNLWLINTSIENQKKIAEYFTSEEMQSTDLIYFLKSPQKPKVLWVLIVSETSYSAPAKVENMTTSNFEDKNLWFYTLKFIE